MKKPTRKVAAGGLAGGLTIITVWAMKQFGNVDVTNEVAQGFTLVFTFLVQHFVKETQ